MLITTLASNHSFTKTDHAAVSESRGMEFCRNEGKELLIYPYILQQGSIMALSEDYEFARKITTVVISTNKSGL